MDKFLKTLIRKAQTFEFDKRLDFWLLSMIVSGGRVLSIASNGRKRTGFVDAYYAQHCNSHSELAAIRNVRKKVDLRGAKIYVVRVKRNRTVALARPCEMCQELLRSYGINRAFYSIGPDEFGEMRLK